MCSHFSEYDFVIVRKPTVCIVLTKFLTILADKAQICRLYDCDRLYVSNKQNKYIYTIYANPCHAEPRKLCICKQCKPRSDWSCRSMLSRTCNIYHFKTNRCSLRSTVFASHVICQKIPSSKQRNQSSN